jgi:hypothetical protein
VDNVPRSGTPSVVLKTRGDVKAALYRFLADELTLFQMVAMEGRSTEERSDG